MKTSVSIMTLALGATAWLAGGETAWPFYNPSTGRWLNRDPAEENGGIHLHAYCRNDTTGAYDALGRFPIAATPDQPSFTLALRAPQLPRGKYCGEVYWECLWSLKGQRSDNKKGGYVIQTITISWKKWREKLVGGILEKERLDMESLKSHPSLIGKDSVTYMEAWEVPADTLGPGNKSENWEWADIFQWGDEALTGTGAAYACNGSVTWKGSATFYYNEPLPGDFKPNNQDTLANGLPSTAKTEGRVFQNGGNTVVHELAIDWRCCDTLGRKSKSQTHIGPHAP
jgi:hypothetical protein